MITKSRNFIVLCTSSFLSVEFIRFVLVGGSTMILCWGSYYFFVEFLGLHYLIATNLATFLAWFYAYLVNKYIVFKNFDKNHTRHGSRFVLLQIGLIVFGNIMMFIGVDIVKLYHFYVLVLVGIMSAIINFILMKMVVFK